MPKPRAIVLPALAALLVAGFVLAYYSLCRDRAQIRVRYQQMRAALSANDTNAVLALVAPQYRSSFGELRFVRLDRFAAPLGPRSSILLIWKEATVWPGRTSGWLVGDTVEMVKVGGNWFFTGKVHLD
jgi:hypothetical protein